MATLTLEQIAEKARNHRVTPAERRAQRVSLIMGLGRKTRRLLATRFQASLTRMKAAKRPKRKLVDSDELTTVNRNARHLLGVFIWRVPCSIVIGN